MPSDLGTGWNLHPSTIIEIGSTVILLWWWGRGEKKVVGSRTDGDTKGDVRCSHSGNFMRVSEDNLEQFLYHP